MVRHAVLSSFALASLLLAVPLQGAPALAGGDGSAGGNSGFTPVGGAALTPIGTATFSTTSDTAPVASSVVALVDAANLSQALVEGGLTQTGASGVLALLTNAETNGVTPEQGAANLTADLQVAGAAAGPAGALAEALGALGSAPSLATLSQAVNAFNALVASADGPALQALAGEISPIRAYLVSVINAVTVGG